MNGTRVELAGKELTQAAASMTANEILLCSEHGGETATNKIKQPKKASSKQANCMGMTEAIKPVHLQPLLYSTIKPFSLLIYLPGLIPRKTTTQASHFPTRASASGPKPTQRPQSNPYPNLQPYQSPNQVTILSIPNQNHIHLTNYHLNPPPSPACPQHQPSKNTPPTSTRTTSSRPTTPTSTTTRPRPSRTPRPSSTTTSRTIKPSRPSRIYRTRFIRRMLNLAMGWRMCSVFWTRLSGPRRAVGWMV